MNTTAQQVSLLHHTLGLRPDQRNPYRNHFVASEGHHDLPDLEALVESGLMGRSPTPKFCTPTDIVFHVTEAGKALAIELLPDPPKLTKYGQWRAYDGDFSFGEFLCGHRLPKIESESEYREVNGRCRFIRRYRMYRFAAYSQWHREVQGDWCATKKDAKASYKAALAKHKATGSNA